MKIRGVEIPEIVILCAICCIVLYFWDSYTYREQHRLSNPVIIEKVYRG